MGRMSKQTRSEQAESGDGLRVRGAHVQGTGTDSRDGVMTWPSDAPYQAGPPADGGQPGPGGEQPGAGQQGGTGQGPSPQDKLNQALAILERSESGKALLDAARAAGVKIGLDQTPQAMGYYSPVDKVIAVNPQLPEANIVGVLAHELRHAWQDQHGLLDRMQRSPEDILWLTRLVEADAEANTLNVLWELASHADPAKRYVEGFEAHKRTNYADEAVAFELAVQADPNAARNGVAMREAFDQWFARPWRRDAYDKGTTEWMEFVMSHYRRSVKSHFVKPQIARLEKLGELPGGGGNYIQASNRTGRYHRLDAECYKGAIAPPIRERLQHIRSFFKFDGQGRNKSHVAGPRGRPQNPAAARPPGAAARGRPDGGDRLGANPGANPGASHAMSLVRQTESVRPRTGLSRPALPTPRRRLAPA